MTLPRLLAVASLVAALAAAGRAAAAPACLSSCSYAAPAGAGALLVFTGHGYGHGVGMSQYGAYGYALHGSDYRAILAHYYPGTTLGPAPARTIRVLLADRRRTLTIRAEADVTVRDGAGKKHTLPAGSYTYTPALRWPAPLTFTPSRGSFLTLGRTYRGSIVVDVVDGRLRAVDVVGLEQYLWGVVPAEMPSTWAPEALKAQAVAARSYALATRAVGAPFDVYADTRSQMYLGVAQETAATTAAVNATKGQVLLFAGNVAKTFFSSSSGGQTESNADWTGTAVPYLVSVPDPYDTLSPYHDWGPVPVTATTLLKALKLTGPVVDVTTTSNPSGRVAQVKLTTPAGPTAVPATTLRSALGLRSTWFSVGLLSLTPPQPLAPVTYGSPVTLASVVRGVGGASLEQRRPGGAWETVRSVAAGASQLTATPTATTDYRLATTAVAAGPVRIKVMPVVTLAAVSAAEVDGSVRPALAGAAVDVQVQGADLSWSSAATGTTGADGSFAVPVALAAGATVRVVVTATGSSFAPGTSASQTVAG
jgi:stage II sporulation protein D